MANTLADLLRKSIMSGVQDDSFNQGANRGSADRENALKRLFTGQEGQLDREAAMARTLVEAKSKEAGLTRDLRKRQAVANITNFDIASDDVIPSTRDAEETKKAAIAKNRLDKEVAAHKALIADSGVLDRFGTIPGVGWGTEKGRLLQGSADRLLGTVKETEGLGVLQPGEVPLARSMAGSSVGIGAMFANKKTLGEGLDKLTDKANEGLAITAAERGYIPKPKRLSRFEELQQKRRAAGLPE